MMAERHAANLRDVIQHNAQPRVGHLVDHLRIGIDDPLVGYAFEEKRWQQQHAKTTSLGCVPG